MDIERLFGRTRRDVATLQEPRGQTVLRRAGYLHVDQRRRATWLPLGVQAMRRLNRHLAPGEADVQEIIGAPSLGGIDEWLFPLLSAEIRSYRQIPATLSWWETPVTRAFLRLAESEPALSDALSNILSLWTTKAQALGLNVAAIRTRERSGEVARSLATLCDEGPDRWLSCTGCETAGHPSALRPGVSSPDPEPPQPMEAVPTPGCTTIQAVADYLGVTTDRTLKAVFYATDEGHIVFAVIRGDLEVDPDKLRYAVGAPIHPATPDELGAAGLVAGYASSVGLQGRPQLTILGDPSIQAEVNFVAGANRPGYHLRHVHYPRDFQVDRIVDLALAQPGDPCPNCGKPFETRAGLLWASAWELRPEDSLTYLDRAGRPAELFIGTARLALDRLLIALADAHHDDHGLCWPPTVAPYPVHVVVLNATNDDVLAATRELEQRLHEAGIEGLWDRRQESPGVKFTDADLIGAPWRITVSQRSVGRSGVELTNRATGERQVLSIAEALRVVETSAP
ncbi:MAG: YbaK/EbsC family protein [Anaerolineae bacterium]